MYFKDFEDFMQKIKASEWKKLGGELYDSKWYVPSGSFASHPYQLNDAMKLGALVLHKSRARGTCAAVLFHTNFPEYLRKNIFFILFLSLYFIIIILYC